MERIRVEKEIYLVRYGEIGLKGTNKRSFEKMLANNIKEALRVLPKEAVDGIVVQDRRGRYFIYYPVGFAESVADILLNVPGVHSISPVFEVKKDMESIIKAASDLMKKEMQLLNSQFVEKIQGSDKISFKIEARRADKNYPLKSPEISAKVGGALLTKVQGLTVDVHKPQIRMDIEIRDNAYLFCHKLFGIEGMPYGSAGRALVLLSGGIDSPVAAYEMARRGVEIEALHFHSFPFTSNRAAQKVESIARLLTKFTLEIQLNSINILEIQSEIKEYCPAQEMTILSRCFMMLIANRLAERRGCMALVTGESIGQVASQTMEGIVVTSSMVSMPVFRPLIASDKSEIIKIAKKIGSYDISIQPFEDCCTVFLPDKVVTRPKLDRIRKSLEKLDVEGLVDRAIREVESIRIGPRVKQ